MGMGQLIGIYQLERTNALYDGKKNNFVYHIFTSHLHIVELKDILIRSSDQPSRP
jgi:hypothetical protein